MDSLNSFCNGFIRSLRFLFQGSLVNLAISDIARLPDLSSYYGELNIVFTNSNDGQNYQIKQQVLRTRISL